MPTLRPYQKEDAEFLVSAPITACFNEQRTGKTPTALHTIILRSIQNKRNLIITTTSALYQWQAEYIKWVERPCVVCEGSLEKRKEIVNSKWTHGLVVSVDSIKVTKASEGLIKEILRMKPECVILDEAHKIKNPSTQAAKAMYKLSKIPYRLALTGTPAVSRAWDIFGILKFLFPNQYKSEYSFKNTYWKSEHKHIIMKGRAHTFLEYTTFKPGMKEALQKELATFSTQRKLREVMPWLPEEDRVIIELTPTKDQKTYIKMLREEFKVSPEIQTVGVLDTLIRERQICAHPALLGLKGKSPKLEYIKQYIKDYPEEPILIFSHFTTFLKLLFDELKQTTKLAAITGSTSPKDRERYKVDFQAGKFNVLLINTIAGKEALTLDRAETEIFADKYPPIGYIEQAEARFIATTEDKASKPHKIIDLIITDTFDADIHKLLKRRKSETDIINNYKLYLTQKGAKK